MAFKLDKYGQQVEDDLNAVEGKTIYPDASHDNDGLMTMGHVRRLEEVEGSVEDIDGAVLSEEEIRMICI